MVYITHAGFRNLRHQTPEFMFAVYQFFRPQILAISHQQVECEETRLTAMKKQVAELGPPALIQTDNLPIEDCLSRKRQGQSFAKVRERVEGISVARD